MNTTPYFQRSIINLEASVLQHQEGRVGIAQLNWLIDFPGVNFFFVPLSNLVSYSIENSSFRRDKHQGLCYNDKVTKDINIIFFFQFRLFFPITEWENSKSYDHLGAIHKWRQIFFEDFGPPSPLSDFYSMKFRNFIK